jgi:replicative DNA helicase
MNKSSATELSRQLWTFSRERRADPKDVWGIPWPWSKLNEITGGIHPEEMTILMGRPGVGKTALLCQISLAVAQWVRDHTAEKVVRIITCEMSARMVHFRMASMLSGVSLRRVMQGKTTDEEQKAFDAALTSLADLPIEYLEPSSMDQSIEWIHAKDQKPTAWFAVDYLQIHPVFGVKGSGSRFQDVNEISGGFRKVAKQVAPGLVLSQMSRKCEERQDKRPILADLRESGNIEQDASLVLGPYREDLYTRVPEEFRSEPKEAQMLVIKHRNGPLGEIPLFWVPPAMMYVEPDKDGDVDALSA